MPGQGRRAARPGGVLSGQALRAFSEGGMCFSPRIFEGRGRRRGGVVYTFTPLSRGSNETCIHQDPVCTRIRFRVRVSVQGRKQRR
eukprot:2718581-Pyramimonas_sp.AAC.1